MRCYICEAQAVEAPKTGDGENIDCPECGPYAISGTAKAMLLRDIRVLNEARSREWLTEERSAGNLRPLISSSTNLW
ncbi:hypothetical protein TUM20286_05570 [Pseudomonas tohonis]|uniref:Uncharacterized protein n=1 Tax=Pseudomonas tohonis TaxID=2725477 RepID=A0ABQ4VUA3_9PSED|nr:hypothetical protein TUM20286_05570 [Pseudomonas tohonis]